MNIRLRDLIQSREKTTIPPVEMIAAPIERKSTMSITGLNSGVITAAIERAKQRLAGKVGEGLSKIEGATAAGESKIDGVTSNLAAKIEKEIEEHVSAFVTQTNGGPV